MVSNGDWVFVVFATYNALCLSQTVQCTLLVENNQQIKVGRKRGTLFIIFLAFHHQSRAELVSTTSSSATVAGYFGIMESWNRGIVEYWNTGINNPLRE
ncbi:uncharacterized protein ASCRUDRAFT_76523 [Ascoidea rubescens DSM 1968]|uniref:Secreted protein n=1 Tax=Ascoidea rubescens DSM 1968 TaxID=1344418 RepID=A0A1D2VFW5_9ASCO|nr:hypothetical protein ASCRUDRAFT_76523 [Ascoidea rubescens DSM 1968]ODV60574.1 hypothetical protein ASCRUDRAFT_76523 [Ascoidea rubescens DSM 1968]